MTPAVGGITDTGQVIDTRRTTVAPGRTTTLTVAVCAVAAIGLFGAHRAGVAALPFMAAAAAWAWVAGIGSTAARDIKGVFTGPLWCVAGAAIASAAAWAAGVSSPLAVGETAAVASVYAMACASHPAISRRVKPGRWTEGPLEVLLLEGGQTRHLALTLPADPFARRLVGIADAWWTPGSPALCGRDLPDAGDTAGICRACATAAVVLCDGRAVAGGTEVGWDDPFLGLVAVLGHLEPERG